MPFCAVLCLVKDEQPDEARVFDAAAPGLSPADAPHLAPSPTDSLVCTSPPYGLRPGGQVMVPGRFFEIIPSS